MNELEYEVYALSLENKDPFQRFFRRKRAETILRELNSLGKRAKVLDIGCGAGIGTLRLASLGFDMTGADKNKKFVEYANSESKSRGLKVKFSLSDLTKNFPQFNNAFDVIIASEVLEHIEDYSSALNNLRRYLKDGGHIIITMPNFHGLAGITEFLWAMKARYNWVHEHRHYICCPRRLETVLKKSGLVPLRTYTAFYISHFLPFISEKLSSFIFSKEQKYMSRANFGELLVSVSRKGYGQLSED